MKPWVESHLSYTTWSVVYKNTSWTCKSFAAARKDDGRGALEEHRGVKDNGALKVKCSLTGLFHVRTQVIDTSPRFYVSLDVLGAALSPVRCA